MNPFVMPLRRYPGRGGSTRSTWASGRISDFEEKKGGVSRLSIPFFIRVIWGYRKCAPESKNSNEFFSCFGSDDHLHPLRGMSDLLRDETKDEISGSSTLVAQEVGFICVKI